MSKYKTVFLDLDDTILNFRASERVAIRATVSHYGIVPDESIISRYSEINRDMWRQLESGLMTRDEIRKKRFEMLFSEIGISASAEEGQAFYEKALSQTVFFMPKALSTIKALSRRYSLYLASNGTAEVQNPRIAASGINRYFKGIFISERIGHNKPSKEFFEHCFSEIEGFEKHDAIIVGDSLSSDIAGGINSGIRTCLYNPDEKPITGDIIPDYEIRSLKELPRLLRRKK